MEVEELRRARSANPFVPFRVIYPGGSAEVMQPEYVGFSPSYRHACISLPDERFVRLEIEKIIRLEEILELDY